GITPRVLVGMALISLAVAWLVVSVLLSVCVRIKAHRFWRSCLLWRLCAKLWQGCKTIFGNWSMTGRAVLIFCLYLAGSLLTGFTLIFFLPYQCIVLYALCRWVIQWRAICSGTAAILGGDADYKIPTDHMYPDLERHAAQLNDLGSAVGSAVDQRMKSERFKAELITNVSHDLKTPLTSIINYVDLLKKIPLENSTADEYIEVLDRKSQRLKKLTEDLVEASKASTGALTVSRERLGMTQLVGQALGEYEEKFAAKNLQVIANLPPDDLYVLADGRHLWRVIDNLFSNCAKYAMGGTRLYLELTRWDGNITFSVKNISSQALNVPPEQLMERFVRGEEARSTEGSGLGLSIARSLTELQGGTFRLAIDGDLFKATITFPEAVAP
ncbi:MAG: HAMP domain-containing sensor histidine kinase, partial [Pseudoflavonifractor sp.]